MDQFEQFLEDEMVHVQGAYPEAIVIHVGSNDLGLMTKSDLLSWCRRIILSTRNLLPWTVIMWSAVLPRVAYPQANSQAAIDKVRKEMNRFVRLLFRGPNACVFIAHPYIRWDSKVMFREDGVHLSDTGCSHLLDDMYWALRDFAF